eukprot:272655-Pyramimonas_sp.AAC.1
MVLAAVCEYESVIGPCFGGVQIARGSTRVNRKGRLLRRPLACLTLWRVSDLADVAGSLLYFCGAGSGLDACFRLDHQLRTLAVSLS